MATSGTVTYRPTAETIIKGALRLVNAYDPENASGPTSTQISLGLEALNQLVKAWEAKGLHLWERRWAVIFPQPEQPFYVLGSPGPSGDHACLTTPLGVSGFVQTTLDDDAASTATTISVDSASSGSTPAVSAVSITSGYNIGIELDDGTMFWTTVNGAPVGTTVTLTAGLTSSASAGNNVFCYQTKLIRPLRVTDGFVRNVPSATSASLPGQNDTPVSVIPREWYNRFGYKFSTGTPTQMYYDPQSNSGYLYVYPTFSTCNQVLYIQFEKPIDDFASESNDFDLPQEWSEALKFALAVRLAPEYEVSSSKFKQLVGLAEMAFQNVENWDQENSSVFLQANNAVAYPVR